MKTTLRNLAPPDRQSLVVLTSAVVLPVVYVYHGSATFFVENLAGPLGLSGDPLVVMYGRFYQFAAVLLLFGIVPAFLARLVVGRRLSDFGLAVGDWRFGATSAAVALVVLAPLLWVTAGQADFQAEYPLAKVATLEPSRFAVYETSYLAYYIGWEAFFRGYMLFGLRDRFGPFGAILFQAFPSVLLHIGKPEGETWAAVVAGLAFGALALRSGSFLYVLALHYAIGVLTDTFCALRGGLL